MPNDSYELAIDEDMQLIGYGQDSNRPYPYYCYCFATPVPISTSTPSYEDSSPIYVPPPYLCGSSVDEVEDEEQIVEPPRVSAEVENLWGLDWT